MTAVLSLLLVMRMDRNVLMKGFENFDIGKPELYQVDCIVRDN